MRSPSIWNAAARCPQAHQPASAQPPPRREVPQPQQKQSISYFVGEWSFSWIGRERARARAS